MHPTGILLIAHAPLATALRQCALHVFPEAASAIAVVDVQPNLSPEESQAAARIAMQELGTDRVLVLTDSFGATPSNVAMRLVDGLRSRLVAGVNLPMLLRCVQKRHESLDELVAGALERGKSGIIAHATSAPQNQARSPTLSAHDQQHRHQQ